jgi:hypothetical protein
VGAVRAFFRRLVIGYFQADIESEIKARVETSTGEWLKSCRAVVHARRAEAPQASPAVTIDWLITQLEFEESRRDRLATIAWGIIADLPPEAHAEHISRLKPLVSPPRAM